MRNEVIGRPGGLGLRVATLTLACLALVGCPGGSSGSTSTTTTADNQPALSQQEAPKPAIKDLGAGFHPVGVSDAGVVVGNVLGGDIAHQTSKVVTWNSGQTTDLPGLPGSMYTTASAISGSGIVVGNSAGRPVIWEDGQISDLGGPPAAVSAVSDSGDAVGYILSGNCPPSGTPVAWFDGKYTPLTGAGNAIAIAVNNHRQVLLHQFGGPHCWFNGGLALWDNGSVKNLPSFPGAYYAALNDSGMVVGGPGAKALEPSGTVVEIGRMANADISEAKSVNRYGETVGVLNDNGGAAGGFPTDQSRAYLWDGSAGVIDLTDFLTKTSPGSGWTLLDAVGINNAASEQIVGVGKLNGQYHGYLLRLNRIPLYVALGDSFSSGEGASDSPMPWIDETGTDTDKCHRSGLSYPFLLAKTSLVPRPFRSFACSGAWALDMLSANQSEEPQTNHLGPDTKLVTITAGGDDAGFGPIATACVLSAFLRKLGLPENIDKLPNIPPELQGSILVDVLRQLEQQSKEWLHEFIAEQATACASTKTVNAIDSVGHKLDRLYTVIHQRAPHAEVLVLLYPSLLPSVDSKDATQAVCAALFGKDLKSDLGWMNKLQSRLNKVVRDAAERHGFKVVDGSDSVFSDHTLCGVQPYVNLPMVTLSNARQVPINLISGIPNDWTKYIDSGSLHPNTSGQQAMATTVQAYLRTHPIR